MEAILFPGRLRPEGKRIVSVGRRLLNNIKVICHSNFVILQNALCASSSGRIGANAWKVKQRENSSSRKKEKDLVGLNALKNGCW